MNQSKPLLHFAPKNIKIHLVVLENELFEVAWLTYFLSLNKFILEYLSQNKSDLEHLSEIKSDLEYLFENKPDLAHS